jgi:4-hydroxy-2-oxoheptanedioate aldolase
VNRRSLNLHDGAARRACKSPAETGGRTQSEHLPKACFPASGTSEEISYVGGHTGHPLNQDRGRQDARIWADYIVVGMEHGSFNMAGLAEYMRGLVESGPTRSGHHTPAVIVEASVNGTDAADVRFNAWQCRQILGCDVHGILLCQAESAGAVRALVESCRYPHHSAGIDPKLPADRANAQGRP